MRLPALITALLYTAALAAANPAAGGPLNAEEQEALKAMRGGDMRKLIVAEQPAPVPDIAFTDPQGGEHRLADSDGRVRLVNFWATWCAPCRLEKPSLDALQEDIGGPDFEVIAIATGPQNVDAIADFNAELGIGSLATRLDPRGELAAAMNVPGLPVTVLLDRDGTEIGRVLGGADWTGDSAREIMAWLIARPN